MCADSSGREDEVLWQDDDDDDDDFGRLSSSCIPTYIQQATSESARARLLFRARKIEDARQSFEKHVHQTVVGR